jgi:hypothetical protein
VPRQGGRVGPARFFVRADGNKRDNGRILLMKMNKCILFVGLVLIVAAYPSWVTGADSCQDVKVLYELQERCGKRAEELFNQYGRLFSKYEDTTWMSRQSSHYNKRLNRCFGVVIHTGIPKQGEPIIGKELWDINENKQYGEFMIFGYEKLLSCDVLGKHCNSESEWDALVKPYMEE